eukprot:1020815-Heterocapsa_arctica.AAC.1
MQLRQCFRAESHFLILRRRRRSSDDLLLQGTTASSASARSAAFRVAGRGGRGSPSSPSKGHVSSLLLDQESSPCRIQAPRA